MSKIVYNACYGGFSLSHEAVLRYTELKGITLTFIRDKSFDDLFRYDLDGEYWDSRDIPRHDPFLVQVVEELGTRANGSHAELRIRELPAGTRYRISEYDGSERVVTIDEYEWSIA